MKRTKTALALPVAISMSFALNSVVAPTLALANEEESVSIDTEVAEPSELETAAENVEGLETRLEIANPIDEGQTWKVGDEIRYRLVVSNDTGADRAFATTGSNLDNWEVCRWMNMSNGGGDLACDTLTHVVTEQDLEAGGFTPTLNAKLYDTPEYSGASQDLTQIVGEHVAVAEAALKLEATPVEAEESYGVGDTVKAMLKIRNISDEALTIEVSSEQGIVSCEEDTIAAHSELECEITHEVSEEDVQLGHVELNATVVGSVESSVVDTATATAQVPLNTAWDESTAFERPDASIELPASLSEAQLLMGHDAENNIRIPALTTASNGDLLASYDRRPVTGGYGGGDSPNGNSIVQRRSSDNGATWGPETVISEGKTGEEKIGFSDPSYVVDKNTGHIFNFHVQSFDSGVFHNNPGYTYTDDGSIDENQRNTMNLGLAVSKDNGRTWENRVITDEVLREVGHELISGFATSGAGIQIENGPRAGRLVQQYAWRMKDESIAAASVYSDDGGESWNIGEFAPSTSVDGEELRYDENTIAELSDGSLLMSSRSNNGKRIFAKSTNGGQTWEDAYYHPDFTAEGNPDSEWNPGDNNAELIRAFPNAAPGSDASKVLVYSFTQGTGRTMGTIAASCDDGATWPVKKVFETGPSGYTTMTVQDDGAIGLLYESSPFNDISYRNFSLAWLDGNLCGIEEGDLGGDAGDNDEDPSSSLSSGLSSGSSSMPGLLR